MNVCMLVYSYPPLPVGGAEHQCRLQAEELVRGGHRCMVVTARILRSLPRTRTEQGVRVVRVGIAQPVVDVLLRLKPRFPGRRKKAEIPTSGPAVQAPRAVSRVECWVSKANTLLFMWNASWQVWRNRKTLEVLHTHVAGWNAGFVAWLGGKLGIPVVCKAANLPAFEELDSRVPFSAALKKWRLRSAYFALTAEMAADLIREGVPKGQIEVLPNGVPPRKDLAAVATSRQALFVGNFTQGAAHKCFDVVLKSWARVARAYPGWTLVMAGGGDATPWEILARELGCEEQVRFPGRIVNLEKVYLESALFLLVSGKEGISNALLEAQSYGLPAVVSDIPGNRAVVTEGVTGLFARPGGVEETADALNRLLSDPNLRVTMGRNANEHLTQTFSISSIVSRMLDAYGRLGTEGFAA